MTAPDYSHYSFRQLYEALNGVRGDLYPEVLNALEAEITKRHDVPKADLEEAYFLLDHAKYPEHQQRLADLVAARGGFDSIAPEVVNEDNKYHTGWRRFWALLFDTLIGLLVLGVCTLPLLKQAQGDVVMTTFINLGSQLLMLCYFILMHATFGQTLGKMITGVKVVRNADEGPISFLRALLRDLVPLMLLAAAVFMLPHSDIIVTSGKKVALQPPAMLGIVSMLSFLWGLMEIVTFLFNKRRRAVHDLIAGTVVIRYLRLSSTAAHDLAAPLRTSVPTHE